MSYLTVRHVFYFVCLFCLSFACADHNIVFVHIGSKVPPCLFTVMKQARYINQDCDIYLLACNSQALQKESETFFKEERIILVDMDLIQKSPEHTKFYDVNKMNPSIANGLWLYATERFFVLWDFMRERNVENVVHLESDSMLYVEIKELLPSLQKAKIAAPFQSLVSCIPCFVFVRDTKSLKLLIDHMVFSMENYEGKCPHTRVNDMRTLASFYKKYGGDVMMPLPTLMPAYRKFYYKRRSRSVEDNDTHLRFLSMNIDLFPGCIFDAAGLGIFLNGNDRRDSPMSGPGTIHSRVLFDPRFFSFLWEKDEQGKKIPYLYFKGENYRIVNLHFHSKMVEDYTSY